MRGAGSGRTAILNVMARSVADSLRAETRDRFAALPPAERVELALALGDDDVAMLMAAQGLNRSQAIDRIRRSRQEGRHASVANEPESA